MILEGSSVNDKVIFQRIDLNYLDLLNITCPKAVYVCSISYYGDVPWKELDQCHNTEKTQN